MTFKHVAVSLAIAATAFSAQAFADNPERDYDFRADLARTAATSVATTTTVVPATQGDRAKTMSQHGHQLAAVTTTKSAYTLARIFPSEDRVSQ